MMWLWAGIGGVIAILAVAGVLQLGVLNPLVDFEDIEETPRERLERWVGSFIAGALLGALAWGLW